MPRKRKAPENVWAERPSKRRTAVAEMRITRTMTTDGPRQAVFKTAELLELILMNLPVKTVFGVQRVCRQFREVVATSTAIQQKLFLQPTGVERQVVSKLMDTRVTRPRGCHVEFRPARELEVRSSLRLGHADPFAHYFKWATHRENSTPRVHPYSIGAYFVKRQDDAGGDTQDRVTPARLNPLLALPAYRLNKSTADIAWTGRGEEVSFTPGITIHIDNESASWRGMQFTDPPTTFAYVNLTVGTGKSWNSWGTLTWDAEDRRGHGLTLGDMIDAGNESRNIRGSNAAVNGRPIGTPIASTLQSIAEHISEASRKPIRVRSGWIDLKGMAIPSEAEWEEMSTAGRTSLRL